MTVLRTVLTGGLLLMSTVGLHAQEQPEADSIVREPAHKVLFESGFYAQALEYLGSRLERPADSLWEEYQTYRAFSLIMLDMRDSAAVVFGQILDQRPRYTLNPVYTSPKLYEVFLEAQRAHRPPVADTSAADTADTGAVAVADTGTSDSTLGEVSPDSATTSAARASDWYRVPLYFVPGGAGQFYNRQPAKAAVLLIAQVVALGASVLTYTQREELYDAQFGWYPGNAESYERYTYSYRIEFGLAALAYAYGVVDAFVVDSRARRRARREAEGR